MGELHMTGEEWIAMVTRPYLRTDEPLTEDRIRMIEAAFEEIPYLHISASN